MRNAFLSLCLLAAASMPAAASSSAGALPALSSLKTLRGGSATVRPAYPEACILKLVARKMNITLSGSVPFPPVRYGSETPLKEFQDAIEPQWGLRPDFVLNAYVFRLNRVYILDDAEYYSRLGRFVDDSLFHEYVHYFQVQYRKDDFSGDAGEFLEMEAIDYQTWFRDAYMIPGVPAAEACRSL